MSTNANILETPSIEQIQKDNMRDCLKQTGIFGPRDIDEFLKKLSIRTFKKGTHLLSEGESSNNCYSIIKGCVRQYYIVDGIEKTTFFYTEEQSIFSFKNSSNNKPTSFYLSCVEDTTLSIISLEEQKAIYEKFPKLEALSRASLLEELRNYQEMLASYITTSPEERYKKLLNERPDLLNRVPLYQLASYLGIKPESLSRIRKRILQK